MPAKRIAIHPVPAVLVASILPLFLGALLSDWAYSTTYEIQWANFASWLIAAALVFAGFALLWAVIDFFRADRAAGRQGVFYLLTLAATFVLGLVNALVHAKDAWAMMPEGLILSAIVFLLSLAAIWSGFSTLVTGDAR